MSRSRSAMKNWLSMLLFTVVTMATGFIVTPLVYEPLGEDRFGLVRTLSEMFAYFGLIAQGLSVSLVPLLAKSIGVGDRDATRRFLAAGLRCYGVVVCCIVLLGVAVLPGIPLAFPVSPALRWELQTAWLINIVGLPLMLAIPLKLVMDIHHRGYLASLAQIAQSLTISSFSVFLVWRGWGVPGVMLAGVLGSLVFALIVLMINRRDYSDLLSGILQVKPARGDIRSITSLSWPTFATMISQRVGMLSDSVFLTLILGPAAAAVLFLNKRLSTIVEGVLRSFSAATWPALVELNARGELDLFNRRMQELTRIVMIIAIAALVPIVCYNTAFVSLWIGPKVQTSTAIAAVGSLNALLVTLSSIFSVPLVSTGNVKMLAVPAIIASVVNVAVSVVLIYVLGPVGPLVGTAVALASINLWYYPRLLQQTFGASPSKIFRACVAPLLWAFPYTALVVLAERETVGFLPLLSRITGLFLILGLMGVCASLFVAFSVVVIFSTEERDLWKARLLTPLLQRFGR